MANRLTKGKALVGAINTDSVTVGSGSSVKGITSGTTSVSFASIPANGTASAAITVTGAAEGDILVVNAKPAMSSSAAVISHVGVQATNTGVVWAGNVSSASVAASAAISYLWVDLT